MIVRTIPYVRPAWDAAEAMGGLCARCVSRAAEGAPAEAGGRLGGVSQEGGVAVGGRERRVWERGRARENRPSGAVRG